MLPLPENNGRLLPAAMEMCFFPAAMEGCFLPAAREGGGRGANASVRDVAPERRAATRILLSESMMPCVER